MRPPSAPDADQLVQLYNAVVAVRKPLREVPRKLIGKVPSWKLKHPNIYAVSVNGNWYIFRSVTYEEVLWFVNTSRLDVMSARDDMRNLNIAGSGMLLAHGGIVNYFVANPFEPLAQDILLESVLLHPENLSLDEMLQGEVSALFDAVWSTTGFMNVKTFAEAMQTARASSQQSEMGLLLFISQGTGIRLSELKQMDVNEIAECAAAAEAVLGKTLPIGESVDKRQQQALRSKITQAALDSAGLSPEDFGKPSDFSQQIAARKQQQQTAQADGGDLPSALDVHMARGVPTGGYARERVKVGMDKENALLSNFGFSPEHATETMRDAEHEHVARALKDRRKR
jgi:hypothetical protein